MGKVNVYNSDHDNKIDTEQPILILPQYSYFGDYQILHNLKSNLIFKTDDKSDTDVIFMCIDKYSFDNLCNYFPKTAENMKRKSLKRRHRFMQ